MEALTELVARLVAWLHLWTADAVCPGGWPWAVSMLGVGVGLLPAAGAAAVAVWRRRIGSHYGGARSVALVAAGVLTAGVAPLVTFVSTGRVFAAAAAGDPVDGLTARQLRSLNTAVCVVGRQNHYLGDSTVTEAFTSGGPAGGRVAAFVLVVVPVLTIALTALSARLAVRRGPRWPARPFWMSLAAAAVLSGPVPLGTAVQLWLGAVVGAFLGVPAVFSMGAPDRAVLARSAAAARLTALRRSGGGPSGGAAAPGRWTAPPARPSTGASGVPSGSGSVPAARGRRWADDLAHRFATRVPEPVVGVARRPRTGAPSRTLVARTAARTAAPGRSATTGADGRFRLVRRLGSGGFGRVWLAYDARLGTTVALKAAHVRDADTEERIRREAGALAAVRHPHCVQIHDLVAADSDRGLAGLEGMVIVMEYVRGDSLGDLVRARGPVDDVAAARIWSSIAGALDAAHSRGVLHRDVKPGNIVVDADAQAHLIDFGIARRTGDATLTAAGFVLGTPDFLAPEVAAGGPATVASDAWQLAAAISFALSGQPPRGEHADAVSGLRAAALGNPPTHLPRSSPHLALLRRALDAEPTRRPSLAEVQRAMRAWLHRSDTGPGAVPARPAAR